MLQKSFFIGLSIRFPTGVELGENLWLALRSTVELVYRRKSDDGEIAKGIKETEEESVPVEQVKCLVLKDDVENETEESSKEKVKRKVNVFFSSRHLSF